MSVGTDESLLAMWVVACLLLGLCLDEVVCHHFWRVDRGVSGSACAFCKHRLLSLASFHPPNLLIHRSLLGGRALVVLCCASPLRCRVPVRLWFHDGQNVAGIPCYVVGALPRHSSSQGGCSVRCEKSLPLFESLFSVGRWLEARVACALYVSRSARGNRQWDG